MTAKEKAEKTVEVLRKRKMAKQKKATLDYIYYVTEAAQRMKKAKGLFRKFRM